MHFDKWWYVDTQLTSPSYFRYLFAFLFLISGQTVAVGPNNEDGWGFLVGLASAGMGHPRGRYSMSKDGREPERDELQAGQFGGGAAFGL